MEQFYRFKTALSAEAGSILANWDPHTHPIITEVSGKDSVLEGMEEGITVTTQTDELNRFE